jgi:hypothetical protein
MNRFDPDSVNGTIHDEALHKGGASSENDRHIHNTPADPKSDKADEPQTDSDEQNRRQQQDEKQQQTQQKTYHSASPVAEALASVIRLSVYLTEAALIGTAKGVQPSTRFATSAADKGAKATAAGTQKTAVKSSEDLYAFRQQTMNNAVYNANRHLKRADEQMTLLRNDDRLQPLLQHLETLQDRPATVAHAMEISNVENRITRNIRENPDLKAAYQKAAQSCEQIERSGWQAMKLGQKLGMENAHVIGDNLAGQLKGLADKGKGLATSNTNLSEMFSSGAEMMSEMAQQIMQALSSMMNTIMGRSNPGKDSGPTQSMGG